MRAESLGTMGSTKHKTVFAKAFSRLSLVDFYTKIPSKPEASTEYKEEETSEEEKEVGKGSTPSTPGRSHEASHGPASTSDTHTKNPDKPSRGVCACGPCVG